MRVVQGEFLNAIFVCEIGNRLLELEIRKGRVSGWTRTDMERVEGGAEVDWFCAKGGLEGQFVDF